MSYIKKVPSVKLSTLKVNQTFVKSRLGLPCITIFRLLNINEDNSIVVESLSSKTLFLLSSYQQVYSLNS